MVVPPGTSSRFSGAKQVEGFGWQVISGEVAVSLVPLLFLPWTLRTESLHKLPIPHWMTSSVLNQALVKRPGSQRLLRLILIWPTITAAARPLNVRLIIPRPDSADLSATYVHHQPERVLRFAAVLNNSGGSNTTIVLHWYYSWRNTTGFSFRNTGRIDQPKSERRADLKRSALSISTLS